MSESRPIRSLRQPFDLTIRVPGSKSLTNRFYVLAALADGASRIRCPLRSDDTDRLLVALETLGIASRWEGDEIVITGGGGRLTGGGTVNLGDGGTPTRFVLALATLASKTVIVDGSARMRDRPVDEGIALLRYLGARIEGSGLPGAGGDPVERLPVRIEPSGPLFGGLCEVGRTQSSQFLSALLLLGPTMARDLELRYREPPTSESYLDLTIDALCRVGVRATAERDAEGVLTGHYVPRQQIRSFTVTIEADASSAAYFAVAAAIVPGARVRLEGISERSHQPDIRLLDALATMGAEVTREADAAVVRGSDFLRGITIDASLFPDAALALAVACATAKGSSTIRGLDTLTVKESDRISALATELAQLGCRTAATANSLMIDPAKRHANPVTIETYRDHRMAMSFAILGLVRQGISIADPGCVAKSYPGFWEDFARLG